jgi:hypothetical protein
VRGWLDRPSISQRRRNAAAAPHSVVASSLGHSNAGKVYPSYLAWFRRWYSTCPYVKYNPGVSVLWAPMGTPSWPVSSPAVLWADGENWNGKLGQPSDPK